MCIGPCVFIFINKYIEKRRHLDTVGMSLFSVSLFVLCILSYISNTFLYPATMGVMILGYADSLAAIVGHAFQERKKKKYEKSVLGTLVFCIVSMLILYIGNIFFEINMPYCLVIFISGTLAFIEARVLPKYDNLMIPMVAFFILDIYVRCFI